MIAADYAFLCALVQKQSGLALGPEKRYLVESRLAPILRDAGFGDLAQLVSTLRHGRDEALLRAVADALATHETFFYRDRPVFDTLRDTILPGLLSARPAGTPIRIWSAAASTGQEAYSLAMVAADLGRSALSRIQILGTDMVPEVVERARSGTYSQMEVQRGLPILSLLKHFTQSGLQWQASPELRSAVAFRVFNLLNDFRALGRFDVILCRNLLIYFDAPTKRALLDRLAGSLAPGGVLCLGGAESVTGLTQALRACDGASPFFVRTGEVAPILPTGGAFARRA